MHKMLYRRLLIFLTGFAIGVLGLSLAYGQDKCPITPEDALVPIPDPDPPPLAGTPELSVAGIKTFVDQHGLSSVAELLGSLPPAMQKNYTMIDQTRTSLPSSVEHPRLIMFGSDARFLIAVGSHPSDHMRETVDMAELDDQSGLWIFRSLDMDTNPPRLADNDTACQACHGSPPRPIWGTYPDWPGAFGPRHDRLTSSQAQTLNRLVDTQALTDRFHSLELVDQRDRYRRPWLGGDILTLPGRVYPYTNTIFNMELGTAVADGIYKRLKSSPLYRELREELLVLSYCAPQNFGAYRSSGAEARVREMLLALGATDDTRDELYRVLGVEPHNAIPLHRLASEPPENWNVSTDSLQGLVNLLVLAELNAEDPTINDILVRTPDRDNGFSRACFASVEESLRYKVYQGWALRGEARQAAREVDFDIDLLRSHQGIFRLVESPLCGYLFERAATDPPVEPDPEPDPGPNPDPAPGPDPKPDPEPETILFEADFDRNRDGFVYLDDAFRKYRPTSLCTRRLPPSWRLQ